MTGEEKFETCEYRSKEKHFVQEKWCCGKKQSPGYLCYMFVDFDKVTPEICADCKFYRKIDG